MAGKMVAWEGSRAAGPDPPAEHRGWKAPSSTLSQLSEDMLLDSRIYLSPNPPPSLNSLHIQAPNLPHDACLRPSSLSSSGQISPS